MSYLLSAVEQILKMLSAEIKLQTDYQLMGRRPSWLSPLQEIYERLSVVVEQNSVGC
jgi:hypothetical protein